MKMIFAIVQDEDKNKVNNALMEKGFRTTRLSTSGGFLRVGNTTMMIGVEEERVQEALDIISAICKPRKQMVTATSPSLDAASFTIPYPVEVTVGGATIFVIDVEQFIHL
ncbi:MAG: cyclic-di-AMP receptor [Clostridia bacterium]|nr:cyclic-di-AMP receptor [Clostridia bacterium]